MNDQTLISRMAAIVVTFSLSACIVFDANAAGGNFLPPSDTPATGTVINDYAAVNNIFGKLVFLDSAASFSAGDRALLIQMKGATVNRSDTSSHGDITSYNSAGRFEFVEIAGVAGGTAILKQSPTVAFQTAGVVQMVRVEKYKNRTLTGTISAMPWNGSKGGVVAIDDEGTLTLQGTIDVTGLGFVGGQLVQEIPFDGCISDQFNYTGAEQMGTGNKGEGITDSPALHRARRGHNANGGGGGNITDGGGGGGGNYGAGGQGGRELDICDYDVNYGGLGGQGLDYAPMNRVFMGGGGGSGSEVSQMATGGPRTGGGIVVIRANKLVGSGGIILANGLTSNNDDVNGADGGGAGGSVAIAVNNSLSGTLEIEVQGGEGGDEFNNEYAHGTGGGGGGGAIVLNGALCSSVTWDARGGVSGISRLGQLVGDPKWGATDGQAGNCLGSFIELPTLEGEDKDFSDIPLTGTSYGSAAHLYDNNIRLGSLISQESKPYDTVDASGDNDDGVVVPEIVLGQSNVFQATVLGSGYLQAWIDWNSDGDFLDTGEQIVSNLQDNQAGDTNSAANNMTFSVDAPSGITPGQTYARFRWSSMVDLDSVTEADDGEVEDYLVTIKAPPLVCGINSIANGLYSTASVSANSRGLSSDTNVYQATFDNQKWQGQVVAYNLKTSGNDGNVNAVVWDAAQLMQRNSRELFSYNPAKASNRGVVFDWDNLSNAQQEVLQAGQSASVGEKRVSWIKGADNDEGDSGPFRVRDKILGDIVHSNINFRGKFTNYGYKQLAGPEGASYAAFLTQKRATTASLYVGANDGMLHAFNADSGRELFAYVPNEIFDKFANLSHIKYGCKESDCIPHEYSVDGKSTVADAYFDDAWHSVLVGTLGLGGKGLYALDVTDPSNFSASDVLWEVSVNQSPDNAGVYEMNMGYSQPTPSVVKMKNGKWAAIVGNGYGSSQQRAMLFIIDIETGHLIKSIDTKYGSSVLHNGLSSPTPVDSDGDFITDTIYAGDLQGNLWAFDVSSSNKDDWGVKYGSSAAPKPLFRACEDVDCVQPQAITAPPQVGRNPNAGLMVYFGTGKYFDLSDNQLSGTPGIDTVYGIQDKGAVVSGRTKLVEQEILAEIAVSSDLVSRVTSTNPVDYSSQKGWYMDLISPPNSKNGERVIAQPLLREGRLVFITMIPSEVCEWGGQSWLMELDALNGRRLTVVPLDVNNDKQFTAEDNVTFNEESTIISGLQKKSLGAVFEFPTIISHSTSSEGKYVAGTNNTMGMFRESSSRFSGRMSWRRIK